MQKSDQFRNFFPGHMVVDKTTQNEDIIRKRSQVSSNSQSQDFAKSQSTHFHSLTSGSTVNSQASNSNRYEDLLASSRHAENRESIEMLSKSVAPLANQISSLQTAISLCINQLKNMGESIDKIKTKQEAQDSLLMALAKDVSESASLEGMRHAHIMDLLSKKTHTEEDADASSQDGMSLSAYFNTRRLRGDGARGSSQSSMELSLTPTPQMTGLCVGQKRPRSSMRASDSLIHSPRLQPQAARLPVLELRPAAAAPIQLDQFEEQACDGSAGLLFDDF